MKLSHGWVRKQVIRLAIGKPRVTTALFFFFLFTVSNYVEFAVGLTGKVNPFLRILVTGAVMATFGAILFYEVIQLFRQVLEIQIIRTVVSSLQHEINNPLNIIQLSAEKLQTLKSYDDPSVRNILANTGRIDDVATKLSRLTQRVRIHVEPGFEGLIDISGSR